jgi:hypothetical protein
MDRNYLDHKISGSTLQSRMDALTAMGIVPDNLAKCRDILRAQELAGQYDLAAALGIINSALEVYPDDHLLTACQKEYQERSQQMVVYEGPIQHIFFHPLIVYPNLAFDGDAMSRGFNDWFVTVREFHLIIEALYKNNFILVDMNDVVEQRTVNGTSSLVRKELRLPPGKKPLIISVDDLNYYPYMQANGTIFRLILDKQGNVAAYSLDPDKKETVSYDNDIIPILDGFIREHPDFSYQGAKGIIALTGYEGVLGYRTNDLNSPVYAQEQKQARALIQRLKNTGWSFACHGYGHLDTARISLERLAADTRKWKDEVESLVGPTTIYIYPFGSRVVPGDERFQYLRQAGFNIFCAVGSGPFFQLGPDYLMLDRRHIDGISLCTQTSQLRDLFDSEAIVDPVRPAF